MTATDYANAAQLGLAPMGGPDQDEERAWDAAREHHHATQEQLKRLRATEEARRLLRAEKVAATDYSVLYLSRTQLLNMPTPQPLITRVLPRHCYVILRGRDQSFKSFVALDWACCLATGKPWQGHTAEPTRVLYIAGEGGYGLAGRIEAWEYAWGENVPDDMLTIRNGALDMHQPGPAFDDLLETIRTGGYGLVVIDTLRRVSGSADGNSSEMGLVVDNLDRLRQATSSGTVLAVAHTDKADNDSRGYSGIEDDADVVWSVKRDEMYVALDLRKMKDGPDGTTIHLVANPTLTSLTLATTTGQPAPNTTESQIRILDTLRHHAIDGIPGSQLLKLAALPESTYYRALKELAAAGQIVNIGTPSRKLWAIPALGDDSHGLSQQQTASDQGVSHDSHDSQTPLPLLPPTPTPLRGGSESERGEKKR